jgi:Flp pilus assembly protein TadD
MRNLCAAFCDLACKRSVEYFASGSRCFVLSSAPSYRPEFSGVNQRGTQKNKSAMVEATMVYLQLFRRWAWQPLSACAAIGATLLISLSQAAQAQTGTDVQSDPMEMGGRNMIHGTVHYPGGQRPGQRLRVTLRGVNRPERFTLTNDSGAFDFNGLRGGSYTITVAAGQGYESASETVEILEATSGRKSGATTQIINVRIELQAKPAAPQSLDTVAVIPEEALAFYKQAISTAGLGDRKHAIELLERAVGICPNFWTAWNELGVQHLRLTQTARALDALRTAVKIEPQAFEPRLNTGIALLQMKDYAHAAMELQRALEMKNDSAPAHLHMGHALVGLNRFAEAERQLSEAIKLGGDATVEAHRWLAAVYIEQHRESRAAEELEKYLTLAPATRDAGRIRDIIRQLRNPLAKN